MVTTMTNKKSMQLPLRFVSLAMVCLSLLITSCDGGLFGTGDGHNTNVMIDGEDTTGSTAGIENGADTGTTGGTTTGATTGTTTGNTGDNQSQSESPTTAFDNMQPGGQSAVPQLRVLNLTPVKVQVGVNDNVVINELAPEQDSGRIELPLDANQLLFTDATMIGTDDQTVLHTIEPFNAAEFSITTVIMRSDENVSIGLITLTTQAEPTDPSTALVRLVQTTTLGDVNSTSSITLIATEPNNSGSDVGFDGLSYDTQATSYVDVLPGSYTLSDTDNRFANENMNVEAGHVYTIVINNATAPVLRVIDDSQ